MENNTCRIAVFYDGNYFLHVSNYYRFQHKRQARLSFDGLHEFIRAETAEKRGRDLRHCQIVDSSYFRGRLSAQQIAGPSAQQVAKLDTEEVTKQNKLLLNDRKFEDALKKAGIASYDLPLAKRPDGRYGEKGVDVMLALTAYKMTSQKKYDVCVLFAGDGDFVPLVKELQDLGAYVILLGWDYEFENPKEPQGKPIVARVSSYLIDYVDYPIMMTDVVDSRARQREPLINGLFMPRDAGPSQKLPATKLQQENQQLPQERVEGSEGQGSIFTLNSDKGFGHIKPDDGSENCFFHCNDLTNDASIENCCLKDRVTFTRVRGEKGSHAINVRLLPKGGQT